eukprot:TRINITY_DN22786_c0_g1_i2.p1 TRINITY_DN22786_c0_g1~~TRINITY_DN22786_c0_g1_i2.p1  ORF type:complete len:390 (+),score=74.85 TRINITY_DN22786_c0_g1_i2:233-1402(+)
MRTLDLEHRFQASILGSRPSLLGRSEAAPVQSGGGSRTLLKGRGRKSGSVVSDTSENGSVANSVASTCAGSSATGTTGPQDKLTGLNAIVGERREHDLGVKAEAQSDGQRAELLRLAREAAARSRGELWEVSAPPKETSPRQGPAAALEASPRELASPAESAISTGPKAEAKTACPTLEDATKPLKEQDIGEAQQAEAPLRASPPAISHKKEANTVQEKPPSAAPTPPGTGSEVTTRSSRNRKQAVDAFREKFGSLDPALLATVPGWSVTARRDEQVVHGPGGQQFASLEAVEAQLGMLILFSKPLGALGKALEQATHQRQKRLREAATTQRSSVDSARPAASEASLGEPSVVPRGGEVRPPPAKRRLSLIGCGKNAPTQDSSFSQHSC